MRDLIELSFTLLRKEWLEGRRSCVLREEATKALLEPGAVVMYSKENPEESWSLEVEEIRASLMFGELCFYMQLPSEHKPMEFDQQEHADTICELMGSAWYKQFSDYFTPILNAGCMGIPKSKMN